MHAMKSGFNTSLMHTDPMMTLGHVTVHAKHLIPFRESILDQPIIKS
jgi:hypothetical protein